MCGIAGIYSPDKYHNVLSDIAGRMADAIHHRGPDDSGVWVDNYANVALSHRRLSIVDLSSAGHQPMVSYNDRYVLVFNGEVYNFQNLRKQLENTETSFSWQGNSDTEVLLAAITIWGLEYALQKSVGMFALALWDIRERNLYLARDRFGEKPLYYGRVGKDFVFGSELKALKSHPDFSNALDRNSLQNYLCYSYIQAPQSIYTGIYKLPAGNILSVDLLHGSESLTSYWSLTDHSVSSFNNNTYNDREILDTLHSKLNRAVANQMIADVPVGAFLSGGIDSSLIVALMQQNSTKSVHTFSIGFTESAYDESSYARAVAQHLGTEHTELIVSPSELLDVVPKLPSLYDEPFGDSSQVPTFLVSQLARKDVAVALSGDGGDEVFGGYNRHRWAAGVWQKMTNLPMPLRTILSKLLLTLPPNYWNTLYSFFEAVLPSRYRMRLPSEKIYKMAHSLSAQNIEELHCQLTSVWKGACSAVIGVDSFESNTVLPNGVSATEQMMFLDMLTYLPGDILTKVDRAAMGVSLETRIPFLDHRIVEYAWHMPLNMKLRNGQGKWALRQLLKKYIPAQLIGRPKMGFGVPIDSWLRGSLRDWAGDLLSENRLRRDGYLASDVIQKLWKEHQSGKYNRHHQLWNVLMFQAWLSEQ